MSDTYEQRIIAYEYTRNKAAAAWFDARPHIERTRENELIFEGGFRIAYDAATKTTSEATGDK